MVGISGFGHHQQLAYGCVVLMCLQFGNEAVCKLKWVSMYLTFLDQVGQLLGLYVVVLFFLASMMGTVIEWILSVASFPWHY